MLQKQEIQSLQTLLPKGQVFTDQASLISYEVDAGLDRGKPEGIVFPHSTDDVVRIVRWAAEHNVPLVARGAGTGLSGGAVADRGGLIVEFSRMNQVLDIDEYGRSAVAQPAVINLALDDQVRAKGLYFPPDPASQRASTIGGNVAENSGGPHCFKYGVMTNYVIGLDVVLADGRAARVGGRALDYPAYDFCGLITGSEGMLALMTAIAVRLVRNPPAVKTMLAVFDSVEEAGVAVSAVIATGLVPAAMEMMDQKIVGIIEDFAHAGLPTDAGAVLIIEVDGYAESLDEQMNEVAHLLQEHGGRNLRIARNAEERNAIWFARKSAAGAITRLTPAYYTVDITVPRSRLAEMLGEVNQICERYGLRAGHVFHAGDGNLHPLILIPRPEDRELVERVHRAGWEMVQACIAKNGSLSGEHGVGIEKRQYMPLMHNAAELAAMQDIKHAFDPHNLLNPGKVFPAPGEDTDLPAQVASSKDASVNNKLLQTNVWTPTAAEEAAKILLAATQARRRVHIASSTTTAVVQQHGADLLLSTQALQGIQVFAPDDLYVTVGVGTLLIEMQTFLATEGKHVPLAAPWPQATIGGLVAANSNAPLRMRYGSIRDNVLCATVVLADGRIIRTGRPVVKNVAGYDLTKVMIGSHGTLGLITDVTLKIAAQPRAQRTWCVPLDDIRQGLLLSRRLLPQALVASALLICKGVSIPGVPTSANGTLIYTAEGMPADVQAEFEQVREAALTIGTNIPLEITSLSGTGLWSNWLGNEQAQLQVRIGVAAKDVAAYINDQSHALNKSAFVADMSSGLIYATANPESINEARQWVEQLRQSALALDGYTIVTKMPEEWQDDLDRWGYTPQTIDIMRRLKKRWDPEGILNAGEFVR